MQVINIYWIKINWKSWWPINILTLCFFYINNKDCFINLWVTDHYTWISPKLSNMCTNFYVNKNKNQKRNYIKFVQYMNYMYNTHFRKLSLLQNIRDDKTAVLHQTGEQFNQIEDTWPSMVVAMRSILFCLLIISAAVMKISALFSKGVNSHCFLALRELSIAFWMISYYKQRHHTTGFQK